MIAADTPAMTRIAPAARHPCVHCPWRVANQGKRHPGGWYAKANLRRLWAGLRRGGDMSCHPTDPSNPVPPGVRPAPAGATALECAGSLILRQREFMRFQRIAEENPEGDAFRLYRERHPRGLTRRGLLAVVERAMLGGVPLIGGLQMTRPDLNEPGISAPGVAAWEPGAMPAAPDTAPRQGPGAGGVG